MAHNGLWSVDVAPETTTRNAAAVQNMSEGLACNRMIS